MKRQRKLSVIKLAISIAAVACLGAGAAAAKQHLTKRLKTSHSAAEYHRAFGRAYFPNAELTTHKGKKVRFFEDVIEGKVVLINFIFTSCKASCPLETARLRKVYDLLRDRMGKDVFFTPFPLIQSTTRQKF